MLSKTIKVCLIGEAKVGKTSLIKKIKDGVFDDEYYINTDNKITSIIYNTNYGDIAFDVIDCSSNESKETKVEYWKKSDAAIIICDDVTGGRIEKLEFYVNYLLNIRPGIPFVICLNTKDSPLNTHDLILFRSNVMNFYGPGGYFEISVKNDTHRLNWPFLNLAQLLTKQKDLVFLEKKSIN